MRLQDKVVLRFSADQQQALHLIAQLSAETNTTTYLVGGIVRDLLLNQPLNDLDIAMVGDAIWFATQLHQQHGGELITHRQFNTATWTPAALQVGSIDIITARSETYAAPAALPTVTAGSMRDDLWRRDFTINTLAMRLDREAYGTLVDLFDGSADLHAGVIRILHPRSFIDDPTRSFRAIRYAKRLDFTLEPNTLTALTSHIDYIHLLTPARIRHELKHILREPNHLAMLQALSELGILTAVHPALKWRPAWGKTFRHLATSPFAEQVEATLLLWLSHLAYEAQLAILARLGMSRKVIDSAEAIHNIQHKLTALAPTAPPSHIERTLRPFVKQPLARWIASIRQINTHLGRWLTMYETTWRHVKPTLNGNDLRALGLKPGPQFRTILDQLRAARIDGNVHTRNDERAFLASILNQGV